MAIIFEDSAKITKKQIPIPQNAKKVFKALKKIYKPYLDNNVRGSKILKSLGSDKKYNKKGANANFNGEEIKQDSVNVNDAKVRLHRMNKLPKNSVEYQLNGGELAANIYRKGIERARGTKEVEAVKPPKPTSNAELKPPTTETEKIKTPNGKITYNASVSESKSINEGMDYGHEFYDYMEEYNASYVFNSFLDDPKGKQNWGVLINPNMYAKALREFTKYGKLINFPTKYIYQWMGIIMKNTAILYANTNIAGHSSYFPYEEFEYFLMEYFYGDDREINVSYNGKVKIQITNEEVLKLCNEENPLIKENSVDKYGQTYFPWVTQSQADRISANNDLMAFQKKHKEIFEYINEYNNEHIHEKIEFNPKNGKLYWTASEFELLDKIGMYDWMQMPDGSDAWSDYGIEPLFKVLNEYNDGLTPEKVLVLVNRALDVYHQRGDMSSIFIEGGSKTLSKLAENKKRNKKKIYITENQINAIKENKKSRFDYYQKYIDRNKELPLLKEYPHYFTKFLKKYDIVDNWGEEPFLTLNYLSNSIIISIGMGKDKNSITDKKQKIYDIIINNDLLSTLIHRYIEDYILPLKYKQDIVDRYARKESIKDVDWSLPKNNFEVTDINGNLKTYLKH